MTGWRRPAFDQPRPISYDPRWMIGCEGWATA